MQIIPVTNDASQIFRTTLGGQELRLVVQWSDGTGTWLFGIEGLLNGAVIHSGFPVLFSTSIDIEGDIIALPLASPEVEVGRQAWGATHELVYLAPSEVPEI